MGTTAGASTGRGLSLRRMAGALAVAGLISTACGIGAEAGGVAQAATAGTAGIEAEAVRAVAADAGKVIAAAAGTAGPAEAAESPVRVPDAAFAALTSGSFQEAGPAAKPKKKVDCRKVKCVALTFDDGPGRYTDRLLRHLARHRARATFFVVGQNVAANPGIVRRTARAGHEIASHSWAHRNLTHLPPAAIRADLRRTDRIIKRVTGKAPTLVRPPYGAFNRTVIRNSPHPLVLWSVDTLDWRYRSSARVARAAVKSVKPGGIILFHDIHPTTVAAMPRVLKALSDKGYHFVTVSELFRGKVPKTAYGIGPSALR